MKYKMNRISGGGCATDAFRNEDDLNCYNILSQNKDSACIFHDFL